MPDILAAKSESFPNCISPITFISVLLKLFITFFIEFLYLKYIWLTELKYCVKKKEKKKKEGRKNVYHLCKIIRNPCVNP